MMLATEIRKLVKIDVPSSGSSFWKINKYFEMMLATEIRKLVKTDVPSTFRQFFCTMY